MTAHDVTEAERAAEAERESEARYRTLLDNLPDAVVVNAEFTYVYANPAALAMLGYERLEDFIGRTPEDIVAREDLPAVRRSWEDPARTVGPVERRWLRRDGTPFPVELSAIQTRWAGRPARVVIARDASARTQLTARIAEMDRIIAVGTLAAGVGHEINNPLAYVVTNLDFATDELSAIAAGLEEDGGGTQGAERAKLVSRIDDLITALGEARAGADRVRAIVRDLRSFSRIEEGERRPISVTRVIDSAVNMGWAEVRHRAKLVKDYGPIPDVTGNESRLAQVFLNLLINAAHAIPEGRAEEEEIRLVTRTDADGRGVIEVTDSGCGVPAEIAARIFDPFFTTKPVGVGTGLGLSICQNIVRGLGGELAMEPLRKGTTFRVTLPPAAPAERPTAEEPVDAAPTKRRGRILVVDDEPAVVRALERGLSREHDVVATTRGLDVIARLERGERFDVLLCDLMMPDISGIELHDTLSVRFPDQATRMVFLSGGAFTPRGRQFLAEVAPRLIDKPFDMATVKALLQELLA